MEITQNKARFGRGGSSISTQKLSHFNNVNLSCASHLVHRLTHIQSTANSDRTGDHGSITLGERLSFKNFVSDMLDSSGQPKSLVQDLVHEIDRCHI